jgi:hypothetical protein
MHAPPSHLTQPRNDLPPRHSPPSRFGLPTSGLQETAESLQSPRRSSPRTNDHGQIPAAQSSIRGRVEDEATLAIAQSRSVEAFSASLDSIRQRQQRQVVNDRYAAAMTAIHMYDAAMLHYQRREQRKEAGEAIDPAEDSKWDRALQDAHDRANVALREYESVLRGHHGFQEQLFTPSTPAQAPPPSAAAATPGLASADQGSPGTPVTFQLEEAAVMEGCNDGAPRLLRHSLADGERGGSGDDHRPSANGDGQRGRQQGFASERGERIGEAALEGERWSKAGRAAAAAGGGGLEERGRYGREDGPSVVLSQIDSMVQAVRVHAAGGQQRPAEWQKSPAEKERNELGGKCPAATAGSRAVFGRRELQGGTEAVDGGVGRERGNARQILEVPLSLPASLPASMPTCLPTCMHANLHTYLSALG